MSIGARLREERLRLNLNQADFAALAGASKRAQLKWEQGESAPAATVLSAFAEAGADVLYIITGKRSADPETWALKIEEQIDQIERRVIDPSQYRLPNQSEEEAEKVAIKRAQSGLRALLDYDTGLMTPELIARAEHLLDIVSNPASLSLIRAADFVQKRRRRERTKSDFIDYLDGAPYMPSGEVLSALVMIVVEYNVPVKVLADLVWDIVFEVSGLPKYSSGNDQADTATT